MKPISTFQDTLQVYLSHCYYHFRSYCYYHCPLPSFLVWRLVLLTAPLKASYTFLVNHLLSLKASNPFLQISNLNLSNGSTRRKAGIVNSLHLRRETITGIGLITHTPKANTPTRKNAAVRLVQSSIVLTTLSFKMVKSIVNLNM